MYRLDDIDKTPNETFYPEQDFDLISDGAINGHGLISALAVSTKPVHTLFFGQGFPTVIKRVKNANGNNIVVEDISPSLEMGYVRCIAPNPENANELLIVSTNYGMPSLLHTSNGGESYMLVEGNLGDENGIPGPSIEWADILVFQGTTNYLLANPLGVFSTTEIKGENTVWQHEGLETIGYALALMIRSRASDGKVVVATHGRDLFAGYLTEPQTKPSTPPVINPPDKPTSFAINNGFKAQIKPFPNPANDNFNISFFAEQEVSIGFTIYSITGTQECQVKPKVYYAGNHNININCSNWKSGNYLVIYEGDVTGRQQFIKKQ